MLLRSLFFISILFVCGTATASTAAVDKIGTSLRAEWQNSTSWHKKRQKVDCFVRLAGRYSDDMAKELGRAGLLIRSVLPAGEGGTIITGSIPLSKLLDVAVLDYVQSVEGSVPVGRKGPMGLK